MAAIKETLADRVFNAVILVILTLFLFIVAYPLYFIIIASFSDPTLVATGQVLFYPRGLTLDAYLEVFRNKSIWIGYRNTIFYAVGGTLWSLFLTVPAAYALSKKRLRGRAFFMFLVVVPMFFGGGMIPTYLNIRNLHLLNSWWVLILTCGVGSYNLILARTFFSSSISPELEEAAIIDGASNFRIFTTIVLPLSKSVLGVLVLYCVVGQWNGYTAALVYLNNSQEKWPLALFLRNILSKAEQLSNDAFSVSTEQYLRNLHLANLLKYAVIIVSTVPLMILYPIMQKFFEKGLMVGSVKG